jgi:hypothetical protein
MYCTQPRITTVVCFDDKNPYNALHPKHSYLKFKTYDIPDADRADQSGSKREDNPLPDGNQEHESCKTT